MSVGRAFSRVPTIGLMNTRGRKAGRRAENGVRAVPTQRSTQRKWCGAKGGSPASHFVQVRHGWPSVSVSPGLGLNWAPSRVVGEKRRQPEAPAGAAAGSLHTKPARKRRPERGGRAMQRLSLEERTPKHPQLAGRTYPPLPAAVVEQQLAQAVFVGNGSFCRVFRVDKWTHARSEACGQPVVREPPAPPAPAAHFLPACRCPPKRQVLPRPHRPCIEPHPPPCCRSSSCALLASKRA